MIAWINGIMVQGTPEEIEHYRGIVAEKSTSTGNQVPEHVKNYFNKPHKVYDHKGEHGQVWFGQDISTGKDYSVQTNVYITPETDIQEIAKNLGDYINRGVRFKGVNMP